MVSSVVESVKYHCNCSVESLVLMYDLEGGDAVVSLVVESLGLLEHFKSV